VGHHAAVLTRVGADPFGEYVRERLRELGVDTTYIAAHPGLHTPLAFAVLDPPDDPPLLFYRQPQAPDLCIEPGDVDEQVVREVPVLWVTGTGMSAEPGATTLRTLLAWRGRRRHTVVDLDYRPMFWPSVDVAREQIGSLLEHATVAVGNRAECEVAVSSAEPETAADRLLDRGLELAIVKMGADGVLVATPSERAVLPPRRVTVVCALGAGDAFGGALVHGLLSGWDPVRTMTFANAAGAIVASRLLCSEAMPTRAEVDAVLDGATSVVQAVPAS
jgi:5-dehydro-2-deoxygluconokinase